MLTERKTAKALYAEMQATREPYLARARRCAELTIPYLLPPEGTRGQDLPTPWQALGAMGVNTLANKITLALMPPNTPFFKLRLQASTKMAVNQAGAKQDVDQLMVQFENRIMEAVDDSSDRVAVVEGVKQLIVAGNVLVYQPPSGATMNVYKLDQYVAKRDRKGNLLRVVIKECISALAVPDELKAAVETELKDHKTTDNTVEIYTVIERMNRLHYQVWQEICDQKVPRSEGILLADTMPYQALRWGRIDGEDYGRGLVEEYLGDLTTLEGLQKAVVEASAAAAKLIFLRNPGSATTAQEFAEAENGDVVDGLENDLKAVQANKLQDMRAAQESISKIEGRLAKAFLMVSSVQRQAERVTAEEIRLMANDLEDSLGGIYSQLTLEFQLPYLKRKIALLQMQNQLPHFPKGSVAPTIVTGIAALGRNHEVTRIMAWAQACSALVGPEEFARRANSESLFKTLGTAYGVEVSDHVKTNEQMAAEAQAQQRAQLTQSVAPEIVKQQTQTK